MWSGFSFFGSRPLDSVGGTSNRAPPHRPECSELFVGGIPADTTIKELKMYFSEFGQIDECRMKEDKLTNKFRGFGFIRFKEPKSVQLVLARKHTIRGCALDVKKAISKEENDRHVNDELLRKIFLAHINSKLTEYHLYNYFRKFDEVESLTLKREGGYGFLLFKSRIGPVKVFDAGEIHLVKGFKIECRTVLARDKIRTQTVTNGPQTQAKAKLAKADDPHLRAVSTLMDDHNEQGEETTRARASELNLSNLDQYCNLSTVDPKASIMDTTSASAKLSKKLKYSGQVFQFPNDETMDNHSKTNDTLLQETSFLDRSQVPVRADGHGSIMFGNILNDEMLRDPQDMFFKGRSDFSHDTDFQLKPKAELVSFGKQPTDRPSKVAVARPSNEDEDEEPPWPGMEHAMGPIDTKALEVKVQKLGLQSNRKGETE